MANNIQDNIEEVEIALGIKNDIRKFSPEWFHEKGQLLSYYDTEAAPYYSDFQKKFGKEALLKLDDSNVLTTLFLCGNKTNMCYILEYDDKYHDLFGSIKGGSANKFPLYFSKENSSWVTGTSQNPKYLTEEQAISYGKKIRNLLVKSLDIVTVNENSLTTINGYLDLSRELEKSVLELFGSIWFSKYLHLIFPKFFPVFHNWERQNKVLRIIGEETDQNSFCRIAKIELFVKKCEISNVVFGKVVKHYCEDKNQIEKPNDDEDVEKQSDNYNVPDEALRLRGGENVIIYGVPGSGKSYLIQEEYLKNAKEDDYERLVFYPDYTYSDFVGQIMPIVNSDKSVSYEFSAGPFTRILKKAYLNPETMYFLIIEEVNRGNAAAIFGDIFQLLDRQKSGNSKYKITNKEIARVVYGEARENEKIFIPSNLTILCTMNTSDQNVFTLDTAFQRRWKMRLVQNSFKEDTTGIGSKTILDSDVTWEEFCDEINSIILKKSETLSSSEDKRLGIHFVEETDLDFDNDWQTTNSQQNHLFAEKVIKYLWDDVFKYDRSALFDSRYKSLDEVIEDFVFHYTKQQRFDIFKEDIRNDLQNAVNESKENKQ